MLSPGLGPVLALLAVLVATRARTPALPAAKDFNPGVKAVASYSRFVLEKHDIIANYWPGSAWIRPSALFYADRPLLLVTGESELRRLLATDGHSVAPLGEGELYVLTERVYWEPVQDLGSVVYSAGGYILVKAHTSPQEGIRSTYIPAAGSSR